MSRRRRKSLALFDEIAAQLEGAARCATSAASVKAPLRRRSRQLIAAEVDPRRDYHLMEFCGGHTHAIFRYGVEDLLPGNVRLVHGPGCPVCVLAVPRLDAAIELAQPARCHAGELRRHAARAGVAPAQPAQGARAGRRRAHGLLGARGAGDRRGASRSAGGVLRHRLRDHDARDRAPHPRGAAARACATSASIAIMW